MYSLIPLIVYVRVCCVRLIHSLFSFGAKELQFA